MNKSDLKDAIEQAPNRRSFVRKLSLAGAAVGTALTLDLKDGKAATQTDVNVVNFALNLEFLEAEFYTVGTTGKTLEQSGFDVGPNPGPTMGGKQVNFSNNLLFTSTVANQIGQDERAHVKLLLGLLGSAAIRRQGRIENAKQSAGLAAFAHCGGQFQMTAGRAVQHHVIAGGIRAQGSDMRQGRDLRVLQIPQNQRAGVQSRRVYSSHPKPAQRLRLKMFQQQITTVRFF